MPGFCKREGLMRIPFGVSRQERPVEVALRTTSEHMSAFAVRRLHLPPSPGLPLRLPDPARKGLGFLLQDGDVAMTELVAGVPS